MTMARLGDDAVIVLREVYTVSKGFSRRRFSVLMAGAVAVPVVGVAPRLASAQDATPGATPSAAGGAATLAEMEGQVFSTGPQGENANRRLGGHADRGGAGRDPGHGGDRRHRHALQRRRLVGGADRRSARPVREDGDRGHRRDRRRFRAGRRRSRTSRPSSPATRASSSPSRPTPSPPRPPTSRPPTRVCKLVFMDNVPQGFTPGEDYVSVVSADNYGNGVVSAHLMAEALGGEGQIGIVFHDADFFVTQQRYDALQGDDRGELSRTSRSSRSKGIAGPDFAGQAEQVASAMLTTQRRPGRHLGRLGRAGRRRHQRRPHRRPRRTTWS